MSMSSNNRIVDRFEDWWRRDNHGLPLMRVIAKRDAPCQPVPMPKAPSTRAEQYTGFDYLFSSMRYYIATRIPGRFLPVPGGEPWAGIPGAVSWRRTPFRA